MRLSVDETLPHYLLPSSRKNSVPDGLPELNQQEPTEKQEMLCTNIKHVYLNWRNESTPDDYIRKHLSIIEKICISYFMVDRNGNPTKPEYHDKVTWNFVKKWNIPWR